MQASTSARAAKKLDSRDIRRSWKRMWSICSVWVRTSVSGRLSPACETISRTFFTSAVGFAAMRSEEHTSELQSHSDLVCRLLLEKKKKEIISTSKDNPQQLRSR